MSSNTEFVTDDVLMKIFPDEIISKIIMYRPVHPIASVIKEKYEDYTYDVCMGWCDCPDGCYDTYYVINNRILVSSFYKYMLNKNTDYND